MTTAHSWPPWVVTSHRRNLDEFSTVVNKALESKADPEPLAWLARFLVVRSSGYVEQSVNELLREYVACRSGGPVRSFANSWLERTKNPNPDALATLVGRFDAAMQVEFGEYLDEQDQRLRRELNFLVDRRNRIAHGLNEGIGAARALALADVAVEIVDWFVLRFNPHR